MRTVEDVLRLLDGMFGGGPGGGDRWTAAGAGWWDAFYADRARGVPFFVDKPDENLVGYVEGGLIRPGRALDLGCGPGRNALYLAERGWRVEAIDLSPKAVDWARENAEQAQASRVRFHCGDAFAADGSLPAGPYDLVYDSGCFHHLPPHRRISYRGLLDRVLAPCGHLGLTCFAPDGDTGGSQVDDADFYRDARLHGGLAYTADDLRRILAPLTAVELRRMNDEPPDSSCFGEPFLWAGLFAVAADITVHTAADAAPQQPA